MSILDEIFLEQQRFYKKFKKASNVIQMSKVNYNQLCEELERNVERIHGMKIVLINTKVPIIEW